MNLTTLFEKIAGMQKQREQMRGNDFRSLVLAIADGKEPDADLVDRVLTAANRTLSDLKTAVEQYHHRLDLRARLDALPKLEAEQRDVLKQIDKANAALNAAENRHAETVGPLVARLEGLKEEMRDAEQCRRELFVDCTDATLLAEMAELTEQLRQARERQRGATEALSRQQSFAVGRHDAAVFEGTREQMENARRAHAAGAWEQELAEAQKLIAALEKEQAKLHERMLAP